MSKETVSSVYSDDNTIFQTTIPVLISYINYGNHLGYDAILSIVQEARIRWLKEHGMTELSINENVGYLVKEASLSYESEAFHGDNLQVSLYVENASKLSFDFKYKIIQMAENRVVATASTKHVFFNFSTRKVSRAPECFVQARKNSMELCCE